MTDGGNRYGWGQRDFSFLSQNNQYTPIAQIFASTLPRAIKMACVDLPEDRQPRFTEEAIKRVTSQLSKLPPRDDIVETMDKLQKAGFEIWPVSNGAKVRPFTILSRGKSKNAHKASTLAMFNNAQQLKADDRGDDHFVKDLEHHIVRLSRYLSSRLRPQCAYRSAAIRSRSQSLILEWCAHLSRI